MALTVQPNDTDGPIHEHFNLSYANYLVLPRTLLQSMPADWQASFVRHLDELDAAFRHVPQAEAYEVIPGTEHLANELSDADLKAVGYSVDWYGGQTPPAGMAGEELDALVPGPDPVPHYNRGRTYIAPAISTTTVEG